MTKFKTNFIALKIRQIEMNLKKISSNRLSIHSAKSFVHTLISRKSHSAVLTVSNYHQKILLYSLLNKNLERNFYSESTFFVKLAFPSKQSHSGSAILLLPRGCKSFATPREQKYCRLFSSISRKIQFCNTFAP